MTDTIDAIDTKRVAELLAALEALRRGSCWCEMGIGNPMVSRHSQGCLAAAEIAGDRREQVHRLVNGHMSDTTDALESLINSEGWRYLSDLARKEWTERERTGRRNALNDTDDKRALDKLRQITAAQEAVEWVLKLPSEEVSRLKRIESPPIQQTSARAVMDHAMGGQSRRGML